MKNKDLEYKVIYCYPGRYKKILYVSREKRDRIKREKMNSMEFNQNIYSNWECDMFGIKDLKQQVEMNGKGIVNAQSSLDSLSFHLSRVEKKLDDLLARIPEKKKETRGRKKKNA